MSQTHTLEGLTLAQRLLRFQTTEFSGSLIALGDDGFAIERWGFHQGKITDLWVGSTVSLLEAILLPSESLKERDRKRFRKQAQSDGRDLGEVILSSGLLSEEEVATRILDAMQAQLAQLIQFPGQFEVLPEEWPDDPPGIAQVLQLQLDIEDSVVSAARLLDDWSLVEFDLPGLKDVYYATPASFSLIQNPGDFPIEVELLGLLDGERDLGEVVTLCGFPPFAVYDVAMNLAMDGMTALINPVQLFQLGCEFERHQESERALRRFERAEERGLDDFDLRFRLAEAYAAVGRTAEAVRHYMIFAEKCVSQFRIEDTIRACSRIIAIDPDNLAIQDRYISLLSKYGKVEEALSQGFALAQRFSSEGKDNRARATLEKILEIAEGNEEVLRLYLSLCEKTEHEEGAKEARRRLGNLFHGREESDKALEFYQGLFVKGEEGPEIRGRLAELHLSAGNHQNAFEHLQSLRGHAGWTPRNAIPQALELFRRLLELDPRAPDVTGWLVDEARSRGDRGALIPLLATHRDALASKGQHSEACRAAENLVTLQPLDLSALRALAHLEARHGNRRKAALHFESIADRMLSSDSEVNEVILVLEELLEADPLSITARQKLLELSPEAERPDLALELQLLQMVGGDPATSDPATTREPQRAETEPNFLELVLEILQGRLRQLHGDQALALERYHHVAQLSVERQRLDFLEESLEHLEEMTPNDPQVKNHRERLEELRTGASRPQRVVQSSVSGITAKLKNMQHGGSAETASSSGAPASQAGATVTVASSKSRALGAVAKLKSLKTGAEPAGTTDAKPSPEKVLSTSPEGSKPPSNAPSPTAGSALESALETPSAPQPKPGKLKGLDKLQALRGGAPAEEVESLEESPPPASKTKAPTMDESPMAIRHPKPKSKAKLGGSASKLSALRKKP